VYGLHDHEHRARVEHDDHQPSVRTATGFPDPDA
jgi:hypothetical protein